MSVDHFLLPINSAELESLLQAPERIYDLTEEREADVRELDVVGLGIIAMTAVSEDDPLAFLQSGAPEEVSGWIGEYAVKDGRVVTCEVDMGYGPASYYKNAFLQEVARKLQPWTVEVFAERYNGSWLDEMGVYPGRWSDPRSKEFLVEKFEVYRSCILEAARSGQHLLVWCA